MPGSTASVTAGHPPEPTLPGTPPGIPGPVRVDTVRLPNGLGTGLPIFPQLTEPREPASPEASNRDRYHLSAEATPLRPQPGENGTSNIGASNLALVSLDPGFPGSQSGGSSDITPVRTMRLAFLGTAFEPGELRRSKPLSPSVRARGPGSNHNSPPPDMIFSSTRAGEAEAGSSDFLGAADTNGVGSWCPEAEDINIVRSLSGENGLEGANGCQ